MAITVGPPVEVDSVTGQEIAVDPASRVIQTGTDSRQNTAYVEEQSSAFDPDFRPTQKGLTDPPLARMQASKTY